MTNLSSCRREHEIKPVLACFPLQNKDHLGHSFPINSSPFFSREENLEKTHTKRTSKSLLLCINSWVKRPLYCHNPFDVGFSLKCNQPTSKFSRTFRPAAASWRTEKQCATALMTFMWVSQSDEERRYRGYRDPPGAADRNPTKFRNTRGIPCVVKKSEYSFMVHSTKGEDVWTRLVRWVCVCVCVYWGTHTLTHTALVKRRDGNLQSREEFVWPALRL